MSTELSTIREIIQRTRELAHFYLDKTKGKDVKKCFVVGDKKLNSIYWLVAHMAWAQSNLILRSTGGPNPELPWLKLFALGKTSDEGEKNGPPFQEIINGFDKVHKLSMEHLGKMDSALLDSTNKLDWEIMGSKTMRAVLIHHIRHEGMHIGHLSWNVTLHGEKTI